VLDVGDWKPPAELRPGPGRAWAFGSRARARLHLQRRIRHAGPVRCFRILVQSEFVIRRSLFSTTRPGDISYKVSLYVGLTHRGAEVDRTVTADSSPRQSICRFTISRPPIPLVVSSVCVALYRYRCVPCGIFRGT
jgi:hypothetical protein